MCVCVCVVGNRRRFEKKIFKKKCVYLICAHTSDCAMLCPMMMVVSLAAAAASFSNLLILAISDSSINDDARNCQ